MSRRHQPRERTPAPKQQTIREQLIALGMLQPQGRPLPTVNGLQSDDTDEDAA